MKIMKRLLFLIGCSTALLCGAELAGVHSVYLLPMSRGLDQFLANRLTNEHMFQVVTDPKLADTVFTDHIGEAFQSQMEALYPPPTPEKPAKPEEKAKDAKDPKDATEKKERKTGDSSAVGMMTDPVNKLANPALTGGFGRAKGTVFLVDAKSHQVIWSAFDPPKGSSNTDLDRAASDIVSRIKKDLYPKTKN
jgi:hypothetical protein